MTARPQDHVRAESWPFLTDRLERMGDVLSR